MSRSKSSLAKSSPTQPASGSGAAAVDTTALDTPVKLTTDLSQVNPMASPALDLQDNLRNALAAPDTHSAPERGAIPIGWALTAVLAGCAAVWACIALVVF